jgi:hypothetical protein
MLQTSIIFTNLCFYFSISRSLLAYFEKSSADENLIKFFSLLRVEEHVVIDYNDYKNISAGDQSLIAGILLASDQKLETLMRQKCSVFCSDDSLLQYSSENYIEKILSFSFDVKVMHLGSVSEKFQHERRCFQSFIRDLIPGEVSLNKEYSDFLSYGQANLKSKRQLSSRYFDQQGFQNKNFSFYGIAMNAVIDVVGLFKKFFFNFFHVSIDRA